MLFRSCRALESLIIRSSTVSTLRATSALVGSKIAMGLGGIYVPTELVSSYKTATNWKAFAANIYPISEYPRTDYSTISDTWEQIFAAEADGTYNTKYKVGDTKSLEINGKTVYMQIAAINSDVLSDGSGNAKITWLCKNLYTSHVMNTPASTTGGWASCGMRSYLTDTVLPLIPATVRDMIKAVDKTYYDNGTTSTLTTSDSIWIPSTREICFTGNSLKETSGVQYSALFTANATSTANATRIKYSEYGNASAWWLRSADNNVNYFYVNSSGSSNYTSSSGSNGVVFGFCT